MIESSALALPGADAPSLVSDFRLLRHRLSELGPPRVILVTSALKGEGKSWVSANIARCYAEFGRARAMLIEANFARPSLAQKLGIEVPLCLAEQLRDRHRHSTAKAWQPAVSGTLSMLLVSPSTREPASAAWPSFQAMLREVAEDSQYDIVIVDGPAALESADASLIGEQVDVALFVARAGQSRTGELVRATKRLAPARIGGVVLLEQEKTRTRFRG